MSSESSTMTESFMTTPRTSIIMPVYNTADSVVRAIESVLAQTDPDFELLIMIDGSPDNSAQVITEYLAIPMSASESSITPITKASQLYATKDSTTLTALG